VSSRRIARLLDATPDPRALELGCGSGHSLRYLAERGARELWGIDLSPVQIAFAEETLRPFAPRVRLIESPMEVDPGVPSDHFDLVFSIYGPGWTTDLPATLALVARYLRPGGCFRQQRGAPGVQLPRVEWDAVHRRGTVLHRRSSRTRIVEGCDADHVYHQGTETVFGGGIGSCRLIWSQLIA
jgi:SAM-dependent methyltransferase